MPIVRLLHSVLCISCSYTLIIEFLGYFTLALLRYCVINRHIPDNRCFGIHFDKFSAEFAFGDEAFFLLAVTLRSGFGTLVHAYLFFTLDNAFSYL